MTRFDEALRRMQDDAAGAYERAAQPGEAPAAPFVAQVRGARTRRLIATAAAGAATVALVVVAAVGLAPLWGASDAAPAGPGEAEWSVDLGAEIYATPLVVGDVAYVGADDGVVRAIDLGSGEVRWEFDAGARLRASVTTDGELLFVAGDDNRVHALRDLGTEAQQVWEVRVATRLAARTPYDVFSSAPTPVAGSLVLGTSGGEVVALDARTGDLQWSFPTGGVVRTTAAVADGVAYIGSADGSLYALDVATGTELWRHGFGAQVTASPGVGGGVVVAGSRGTDVVGLDAATGEQLWTYSLAPSWAESSPVIVDGVAVFGSSAAGMVTAVDLYTGQLRWESFVRGWPWARPAVADGRVYATTALVEASEPWPHTVYALDASTGVPVWQAATGPALEWRPEGSAKGSLAGPAVTPHLIIVVGLDGTVTAFAR